MTKLEAESLRENAQLYIGRELIMANEQKQNETYTFTSTRFSRISESNIDSGYRAFAILSPVNKGNPLSVSLKRVLKHFEDEKDKEL